MKEIKILRQLIREVVATGRKLDRYTTAIRRQVVNAIKDEEVRSYFLKNGKAKFVLQDVPEVEELDYVRHVIINMYAGKGVMADASYEFDLDATPEQRKSSDLIVNLTLPRDFKDNILEYVNEELADSIRHELEHSGQETWELMDCQKKTPSANTIWDTLKNAAEYYSCPAEIKAYVTGFMKRAKINKEPLSKIIDVELQHIHQAGKVKGYKEKELLDFIGDLKTKYYEYAKLRYPKSK